MSKVIKRGMMISQQGPFNLDGLLKTPVIGRNDEHIVGVPDLPRENCGLRKAEHQMTDQLLEGRVGPHLFKTLPAHFHLHVRSISTARFDPSLVIQRQNGAQVFHLVTQESRLLDGASVLVQEDSHHARSQNHGIHMRVQADFIHPLPILLLEFGGRARTRELLKKHFDVFVHAG
ncbi:MAG: hypothetical protein K0S45_4425 [Nitrospira sp.]|nr:hypothetical protein [Nitrospira sp.]